MLAVRASYRPTVDARNEPERAYDEEINRCFDDYARITGQMLLEQFYDGDRREFCERVRALQVRLLEWLEPYKKRSLTPETSLLFGMLGFMSNPEPFLKQPRKKKKRP
jgi:hypothetical protein